MSARLKQQSARQQEAAGVSLPYWVTNLDGPINYHMKLMLLTPEELDRLVIYCRKHAAKVNPSPTDNRTNLDYPPTNRERCDVLRHICLNRTERNSGTLAGYASGYDAMLHRIACKGVDVEARQLELKRHIMLLIAEHYPYLKDEVEYQFWLTESGLRPRRSTQ